MHGIEYIVCECYQIVKTEFDRFKVAVGKAGEA